MPRGYYVRVGDKKNVAKFTDEIEIGRASCRERV